MLRPAVLVLLVVAAGCVSAQKEIPGALVDPADLIGAPIEQLHDHTDASLHVGAHGLRLVAWAPLIPDDLGKEGFAGMRLVGDLAYIATDGAYAGFLIVDLSDPTAPRLVSQYKSPGGASQEAVPDKKGDWVYLNLQRQPSPEELLAAPDRGTGWGIQIVDVRDKAAPRFHAFHPVEVRGTHVMMHAERGGKEYLIYNGQPERRQLPTGEFYTPPAGNAIKITEIVDVAGRRTLRTVGEVVLPESATARTSQGCFPHDQWAEEHSATKQWLLYVAYWDCGAVTVDITDPSRPRILDVEATLEPSTRHRIHFFRPDPTPREGRHIAWSGPEIDLSPGEPGYLRAYDVTDPADLKQVGHWRLPGEVENDKPFVFSPHNFDYDGDLMALAHYHAGVWLLDVSDPTAPRHVAYYLPHGAEGAPYRGEVWRKTPNFPEAYFPNVYEVKWHHAKDGKTYLLATERGSGLYVLEREAPPS